MNIRDMQERRAVLVAEMRQITSKPAGTGGDLSAEQVQKFDSLKTELQGVEASIERQKLIDDAERRMQGTTLAGTGDKRLDDELRSFSLRKAICMQIPDLANQIDCGRERELSAEIAKRSGRTFQGIAVPMQIFEMEHRTIVGAGGSPDAGGSHLVGTDLRADQFIDALRAKMRVRALGARILSGLVGDVDVPKQAAGANTGWVAEDSDLPMSDPTFTKIQFRPKHVGVISEYSRNMLLQSSPDIEQLIRMSHAKDIANALDIAALNGAGTTDPLGILNQSGLASVNGPVSWTAIMQMIETVEEANADNEGAGWLSTPAMKRLLRTTAKVASTDSRMIMEFSEDLAGYRFQTTTNMPSTLGSPAQSHALVFGDWSQILIAFWSELDVLVNPYETSAYRRGNTKVRAMATCDIGVRHVQSFCAMTNVNPG